MNNLIKYYLIIGLSLSSSVFAIPANQSGIVNSTPYFFLLTQTQPYAHSAKCEDSCEPILDPQPKNAQQWVNILHSSGWITLEYDICTSIDDDAEEDLKCKGYLGHASFRFIKDSTIFADFKGGTGELSAYQPGTPFQVTFKPNNQPGLDFPEPSTYSTTPYRGVNLAGAEFDSGFQPPAAQDALYYVQKGVNTVRIPFKWEYIQPDPSQPIDFNQGNAKTLANLVNTLTQTGVYVILDMHNNMRYNGEIIGAAGSKTTAANYAAAWKSIAAKFKNNDRIFFDLMNEPYRMETETILSNYNAAIAAIRSVGFFNLILLEGNAWSGVSNWSKNWYGTPNSVVFTKKNIIDPEDNYAINVHQYFDDPQGGGGGSGECVDPAKMFHIENFPGFITWLHTTKQKAFLSEIGALATQNCIKDVDEYLQNIESDYNQFIGWTAWAGGHSWAGSDYPLDLTPNKDGTQKTLMLQAIEKHLATPESVDRDDSDRDER